MPLSIVGATQAVRSGSIITLPVPSGVQDGDLLLVGVHQDSGSEAALTPPTGWTKRNFWSLTGGHGLHVYWRVANSEPASYDWTDSAAAVGFCLAIRGQDTTTPFDVADGAPAQVNGSSISTNSITTQTADALLVAIACQNVGTITDFTPPSGFTERADAAVGWAAITCATNSAATVGSYGPYTFVSAQSNNSAGWLTAIRPASSGANLAAQNASATATGANVATAQTHSLAAQNAASAATSANVAATQSHSLALQNATASASGANIALGASGLILQNASAAATGANLAITQTHSLTAQSASNAASSANIAFSQTHSLALQGGAAAASGASIALGGSGLVPQNANAAATSSNVGLIQTHSLISQSASSAVSSANIAATQTHTLIAQSAANTIASSNLAIIQTHALAIQSASANANALALALAQSHTLSASSAIIPATGANIALYTLAPPRSGVSVRLSDNPYSVSIQPGEYSAVLKEE